MTRLRDIPRNVVESIKDIFNKPSAPATLGPSTQYSPGELGSLANVPSSVDYIKNQNPNRNLGGGGDGGRTLTISGGGIDYAELQRQEALEKARLEAERQRIEAEKNRLVLEARQDYLKNLRSAQGVQGRQEELNKLNQRIAEADIKAQSQRQQAGISKITQISGRTNVQVVSGGREQAVAEALRKQYGEIGGYGETGYVKGNYAEILPGTTGVSNISNISKLGFDTSTISGRAKYYLIEKDPVLNFLATKIKALEERKIQNPSELNKLNEQVTQRLKEITPKGNNEGFSLTQKYFETTGKLTSALGLGGITFYKKGEREQITKDVLKELNEARDYESQQRAIQNLQSKGINVQLKDGKDVVDTSNIAPTNKLANILVGTTDIFFKGALFKPFMETGAVKKTTTQAKVVEKVSTKKAEKLIEKAEELFKSGELEKELYKLNKLATTETRTANLKTLLDELKNRNLIKGYVQDTNTGKFVLLDSSGKMIVPEITNTAPKLTLEFDISELANAPRMTNLPSTTTGTSVLNTNQQSLFFKGRFEGTAPSGKIESMTGMGKIQGLGELGRFKTSLETNQETSQKNMLGLRTPQRTSQRTQQEQKAKQQEGLKQPSALSLGLVSLLKQQQRQQQQQRQIQKQVQQQKYKQGTQFNKPSFKIPPFTFGLGKAFSKLKSMDEDEFEAIGIRFGKEISLKKGTKTQTGEELESFLKTTLGASGFLKKGPVKLKAEETGLLRKGFIKSKISPFKVVEKRERRLKKGGQEVREIKYFKKR
jgi:hypothetical protein